MTSTIEGEDLAFGCIEALWDCKATDPKLAIFIHAADGGVFDYLKLSSKLSPAYRSYGISAICPGNLSTPPRTVSGYADQYLKLLNSANLIPDLIIGWSSGGWIALELCQLFEKAGRCAPVLVALDTHAPLIAPTPWQCEIASRLGWTSHDEWLAFLFFVIWEAQRKEISHTFWDLTDYQKCEFLLANKDNKSVISDARFLSFSKKPEEINIIKEIIASLCLSPILYSPSKVEAHIISVFVFDESIHTSFEAISKSVKELWKKISLGKLDLIGLIGRHDAPLNYPDVSTIADLLLKLADE